MATKFSLEEMSRKGYLVLSGSTYEANKDCIIVFLDSIVISDVFFDDGYWHVVAQDSGREHQVKQTDKKFKVYKQI